MELLGAVRVLCIRNCGFGVLRWLRISFLNQNQTSLIHYVSETAARVRGVLSALSCCHKPHCCHFLSITLHITTPPLNPSPLYFPSLENHNSFSKSKVFCLHEDSVPAYTRKPARTDYFHDVLYMRNLVSILHLCISLPSPSSPSRSLSSKDSLHTPTFSLQRTMTLNPKKNPET